MHTATVRAPALPAIARTAYAQRDSSSDSLRPSKVCANTQMGGFPAGLVLAGFSSVKGLRVHARSVFRAPAKEVATGGNAK